MPRSNKYMRLSACNEEEMQGGFLSPKKNRMSETLFEPAEQISKKKKFKVLVDLKQLRGTSHMPKF